MYRIIEIRNNKEYIHPENDSLFSGVYAEDLLDYHQDRAKNLHPDFINSDNTPCEYKLEQY